MRNLVHCGSHNSGVYAIKAFPWEVHVKGFAMVRLEDARKARTLVGKSSTERNEPRVSNLRTRIRSQISLWLSQKRCVGVEWKTI
jgi:hypothetical protein